MRIRAAAGKTTVVAASSITLVQVLTGANNQALLTEFGISFNGIDSVAEPIEVQLVVQTSAGTASVLSPVLVERPNSGSIQTSAQDTFTAEPTTTDILHRVFVHPQSGYVYTVPDPQAFKLPGGLRLAVRIVTPASVGTLSALAYIELEE